MVSKLANGKLLKLVEGDITRIPVDAIVNAANSELAGGGGVDGAIHRAGGPSLMRDLDAIRAKSGGCPTGSAVVTGAGKLPAQYVLHAVGPVWHGGTNGEPELLRSCYVTCFRLAEELGARSISFPAISTGVYGYPAALAAQIAVAEMMRYLETDGSVEEMLAVVFGRAAWEVYAQELTGRGGTRGGTTG